MTIGKLVHNPGAGQEDHTNQELKSLIESHGFTCRYASTKEENWQEVEDDLDLMIIAGGDGTVRKTAKALLKQDKHIPLALLPLGTANNIAKTLGITGSEESSIARWNLEQLRPFDVGQVDGLPGEAFFLESFGCGLLAHLIKTMRELDLDPIETPEEEIKLALTKLQEHIQNYPAQTCQLIIDGVDFSGDYVLVEIMNIRSVGPNLELAPLADPGDGRLEVVLVADHQRGELASYVLSRQKEADNSFSGKSISAKTVQLTGIDRDCHLDDELISITQATQLILGLEPGRLTFLST